MSAPVDAKMLRLMVRFGARSPVGGMNRQLGGRQVNRVAAAARRDPGHDGANQNREKSAAFDQRVAGRQFRAAEMVWQDAIFDRAE